MSGGAASFGAPHTPPRVVSSCGATVFRTSLFFSQPRNGTFFKPEISTLLTVSSRSFSREPWKEKKNSTKIKSTSWFQPSSDFGQESSDGDFIVVNFYRFVYIKDPEEEVAKHLSFLQGRDIHGRIYVNEQGINAQYSGPAKDSLAYVNWLKEDDRFSDISVQISSAVSGHAFPRLKLRYKSSLVQLEGGISHLPLLDSAMRATPLSPSEWKKKLQAANNVDHSFSEEDGSDNMRKFLLLDVRNELSSFISLMDQYQSNSPGFYVQCGGYEWDVGHFHGAQRPDVDCFRSTSFGLSESEQVASDPLAGVDKDHTDVLMYCTGGIRCDVYSTILRQRGFQNLYTLQGGVSHYLKCEGPVEWVGNLFVFDSRLSMPPPAYKPKAVANGAELASEKRTFASCYICGSRVHELRHRNCANLDCNLLFLSCSSCVEEFRGCCCLDCKSAPRLRPVLPGHQRYQKWHVYRDAVVQSKLLV